MPPSNPPTDENGVIKISFSHLSLRFRSVLLATMIIGVTSGSWHIIGQAQNAISPLTVDKTTVNQTAELKRVQRVHDLEIKLIKATAELTLVLSQLENTDKKLLDQLSALETRVDTLTQLVAANYTATTAGSPQRHKAAKAVAEKVKTDPLSVLAP